MPCRHMLHKQKGYKVTFKKVHSVLGGRLGWEGHQARAPSFSPWEPQATSSLWVGLRVGYGPQALGQVEADSLTP